MALSVHRLRKVFAGAAIVIVLVVAGFYLVRRVAVERARVEIPKKLGVDIQQSTEGFTLSKSEGGRTLFTVKASKAVQFKSGGRAELKDVSIVVYGRRSDRFDQIYGADFEYDPQTSEVSAHGEVHIDLEADTQGPQRADQSPPEELKNPIHLRTSGLVFNQKTGIAGTREAIEFRIPQASGTAKGARYDSRANVLQLESEIRVTIAGRTNAQLKAARGEVTKEPRRAVLHDVQVERAGSSLTADRVTIFLRADNSVERVLAEGNINAADRSSHLRAPRAEFLLGKDGGLRSSVLTGGVLLDAVTDAEMHAQAGNVRMEFASGNRVVKVRADGNAHFTQVPRKSHATVKSDQAMDLTAEAVDFLLGSKGNLERAVTSGASRITLAPARDDGKPGAKTVITAGRFDAAFGGRNRLKALHGEPDARVVSASPGEADKISASRELDVAFGPAGGVSSIVQQGGVRYTEGARSATAEKARYTPGTDELVLTGSPRYTEGAIATSAKTLRLNRRSGEASAEGEVKTTYLPAGGRSGDGLLTGADPIHVTAATMTARTATSVARYRGQARLWQGANLVEAPMIEFDRERRTLLAQGSEAAAEGGRATRVSTVFLHTDKDRKTTPVTVTAARLRYGDTLRRARFEGGVSVRGADLTISADHAEVLLAAREGPSSGGGDGVQPSRMESVVAEGGVVIQEARRKATGEKLVYTAAEGKFVLTGGGANPPSIFDAELGTTTGDSLTFFMRDDRVLVGSSSSSPTVTQTRVKK
ncbi:MAG: LptA/OstA family protein [Terriglobales bacterium]